MNAPKNNVCRAAPFELRAADDGDGFTLEGYAAVFDTPTRIDSWEGQFDEVIARGAFRKTIAERMPVLQFDHGRDVATGSVPIGSIEELKEDRKGLFVRARLHDNARVEPIRQAIDSGAIDGMSFRFRVLTESWKKGENKQVDQRTIREVELFELGPVVFPAYEATTVGVRSLLADLDDDERLSLVRSLAAEVAPLVDQRRTVLTNLTGNVVTDLPNIALGRLTEYARDETVAGQQTTTDQPPDAAPQGTSGSPNHDPIRLRLHAWAAGVSLDALEAS